MKILKTIYMTATVLCILIAAFFLSRPYHTTDGLLAGFCFTCCAIGFVILFGSECTKIENKK